MHPTFRLAAIAVAAATVSLGAAAQEFPGSKNVTIVVPFSAGGPPTAWHATWPKPCASLWAAPPW